MLHQEKQSVYGNIGVMFSHIYMHYFQRLRMESAVLTISIALNTHGLQHEMINNKKMSIILVSDNLAPGYAFINKIWI